MGLIIYLTGAVIMALILFSIFHDNTYDGYRTVLIFCAVIWPAWIFVGIGFGLSRFISSIAKSFRV